MADGIASLLCHDVTTAKKYYDVNRGKTAATKTRLTLSKKMIVAKKRIQATAKKLDRARSLAPTTRSTAMSKTTSSTPTPTSTTTSSTTAADSEAAGPSTARFELAKLLENLKDQKLSPRDKFVQIVEKAGPVRLP